MKFIILIIFTLVLLLDYSCKSPVKTKSSHSEDFSEYYNRLSNLPNDSMVLTANQILVPIGLRDLDFLDGYKIPTFTARDIQGKVQNVNYKDKLTLLNFWFIACPPCVEEIPFLNAMQDKFKGKLEIVSICRDEEVAIFEFELKHPMHYTVIPDAQELIDKRFKMRWGYPKNILVGSDGTVLAMTRGFLGTDDINYKKIEDLIMQNIGE